MAGQAIEVKEAFLNLAQDRFKLAAEAEATIRRDALDDLKFSIGEQWPMDIMSMYRKTKNRFQAVRAADFNGQWACPLGTGIDGGVGVTS